jgi:cytoskeletal protein RodZ
LRQACRSDPDFWFYKAQSLSEKAYLMRFSANLEKYLLGLILSGAALWFAGCSESASTPKPAPPSTGSTSPKVNSDGSVSASRGESTASRDESTGDAATSSSSSSSSDDEEKPKADGDEEQAGSTTGRDVPEAAPPKDE